MTCAVTCNGPQLVALASQMGIAIALTGVAYVAAIALQRRVQQHPLANPVLIGMLLVIGVLSVSEIELDSYLSGSGIMLFLLKTATVALAVPLYQQRERLRAAWKPIVASVIVGTSVSVISTLLLMASLGGTELTALSLASKSATTPVAMGITAQLGGLPPLAAVAVILTGILGAIAGLPILRRLGYEDTRVLGISLGITAHGIGTARALQIDTTLGAYSGLAMSLTAIATALLVPSLWSLLAPLLF